MNHAIRITLPYEGCKDIISRWADRCNAIVAYQHDADEETSKTHVHLALWKCEVRYEALKRMWPDAPGKGNEFWSFKEWTPVFNDNGFMKADKYIAYMSKGKLRPVFVKNISPDLLEESRQAWVEPVLGNDKPRDQSESLIKEIVEYFKVSSKPDYYHDDDTCEIGKDSLELLFDQVRSKAFKVLWAQQRKAPHASYYKIIASTAFLRLCEDTRRFEAGSAIVREKWY